MNSISNFNLSQYRKSLLTQLSNRNRKESFFYIDIIQELKNMHTKNKELKEQNELLIKEISAFKKEIIRYFSHLKLMISSYSKSVGSNYSQMDQLEKELAKILKENKIYANKLVEMMSDNIKLKETNEIMTAKNRQMNKRVNEVEEMLKSFQITNKTLSENECYLKQSISYAEKENFILNEY